MLAVGEHTLKLAAIWTDMTNRTELSNVVWTSNNQSVATVGENGEVKGLSNGLVTITATANGKSASVTINVQNKLASVQLRTSDASLAVGLARETVFASQRFANPTNVKSDDSKIANSTRIVVEGEKVGATEEELELFYSAYDLKSSRAENTHISTIPCATNSSLRTKAERSKAKASRKSSSKSAQNILNTRV